jgi:two-component system cell cycle sensor histidine kinase/response regulator CckA
LLTSLFDTSGFPARWYCGSWSDLHGWTHIVADLAIFGAYFAIPCLLGYFLLRRKDLPFLPVFWLFAAFILFCGIGHAVEASIFWHPWYRLSALVKVLTAIVSWATVVALVPLVPRALSLPRLALVNARLNREIHRRQRSERYRIELDRKMQQAQKMESLGVLAGGIAHDFNNLLTSIMGFAELAQAESDAHSPAREYLSQVMVGAKRAAQLTQQMLDYSGKGRFVVEPVDCAALVASIRDLLQVSISKNCAIRFDAPPNIPLIEGDASQLQQVVMNLIINASEAIGETPGVIDVSVGRMTCDRGYLGQLHFGDQLPAGEYLFLNVSDNGCGMSDDTKGKIFDPFFSTKFAGRGLGLAATLGIVRAHRGGIRVESQVGQGTTIQVLFPIPGHPVEGSTRTDALQHLPQGTGKILIVDDEKPLRNLAAQMLQTLGFTVQTASSGPEAIELFRQDSSRYRLILLDMTMPEMGGIAVIRELRNFKQDVKVILMSGYSEQDVREQLGDERPAGFLQKPFQRTQLWEAVDRTLKVMNS